MIEIQGDAGAVLGGAAGAGRGVMGLRWVISAYRRSVRCARPGDDLWRDPGVNGWVLVRRKDVGGCGWVTGLGYELRSSTRFWDL